MDILGSSIGRYPRNSVVNAQGNVVVKAIFDIITAIEDEPAGNAANAAVKIFELQRGDRNTIKRALHVLKTRCIHSMPTSDLSTLSDPQLGMMMVTNAEIFVVSGIRADTVFDARSCRSTRIVRDRAQSFP